MRPPRLGSFSDKMIKGALGATVGVTTGSALTSVGLTGIGTTIHLLV